MLSLLAAAISFAAQATSEVTTFAVLPATTDPEIRTYNFPHWIYVNRDILVDHRQGLPEDRHQLLLWLTGTGGRGHDAQGFARLAANLGYHVVSIMYPDDIPASTCDFDSNPVALERFRLAIIQGGDASIKGGRESFSLDQGESIENRLQKLLRFLTPLRPRENWGQFLNPDGSIKWESIAVAGQSQGGGHAALIGIKHRVARVLCFGAPKDYSKRLNAPAAWYQDRSSTPKSCFFAFNHVQDPKGCTPEQLYRNLQSLGLEAFGSPANVDGESSPFRHARILYTEYPAVIVTGEESEGAKIAHGSAISTQNAERWKAVWTYMLTEDTN